MPATKLLNKALAKHNQHKYEQAMKLYLEILKKYPYNLDANYLLGTLYAEVNRLTEAKLYLTKAASLAPNSPFIQANLGNLYYVNGSYEPALKCFTRAIELKHDLAEAHLGLARLLLSSGKTEALDYFASAAQLNPQLPGVYTSFGIACLKFDRVKEATEKLHLAMQYDPNDVKAQYFLSISEGRQPDKDLQEKYVQKEFNGFASNFDSTLVENLEYRLPSQIKELIEEVCGSNMHFERVADLGCGTGLIGDLFRQCADQLIGIDISEKMIQAARNKGCYSDLIHGEIVKAIDEINNLFDLFIATDVIIYFSDIDELFRAIKNKAKSGALFVFTTERHNGEGFIVQKTGRFAHSPEYVKSLSEKYGCAIIKEKLIPLRKEWGDWITGDAFVIKFP